MSSLFPTIPLEIGEFRQRLLNLKTRQLFEESYITEEVFKSGTVRDLRELRSILNRLLDPVLQPRLFVQPTIVTLAPSYTTATERWLLRELFYKVGAYKTVIFPNILAHAVGSGVGFQDEGGSLIFDLGYGFAEVALVSLGRVVKSQTSFFAGSWLEYQVDSQVRAKYRLALTAKERQRVLKDLLSLSLKRKILVKGQNLNSGQMESIKLDSVEFEALVTKLADRYVHLVKQLLKSASAEMVIGAMEKGLILTGGLAQLDGLTQYLTTKLKFPVLLAEDPSLGGVLGLSRLATELKDSLSLAFSQD